MLEALAKERNDRSFLSLSFQGQFYQDSRVSLEKHLVYNYTIFQVGRTEGDWK